MSVDGSTKDYNFGPKNHWRRTQWNEVLRRTKGREKSELVIYLPGSQDIDRTISTAKGVPYSNLVAVDLDTENVAKVRASKGSAIEADLIDVLWSWPDNHPVCAVLMDFCSGLEFNNTAVYDPLARRPFRNAVAVANFMRGRDSWSNPTRAILEKAGLLRDIEFLDGQRVQSTSRALQFLLRHTVEILSIACGGVAPSAPGNTQRGKKLEIAFIESSSSEHHEYVRMVLTILKSMRPKFFTYRSGVLTFDSVVFNHHTVRMSDDVKELIWSDPEMLSIEKANCSAEVRRKIAATLAVRTHRLKQIA